MVVFINGSNLNINWSLAEHHCVLSRFCIIVTNLLTKKEIINIPMQKLKNKKIFENVIQPCNHYQLTVNSVDIANKKTYNSIRFIAPPRILATRSSENGGTIQLTVKYDGVQDCIPGSKIQVLVDHPNGTTTVHDVNDLKITGTSDLDCDGCSLRFITRNKHGIGIPVTPLIVGTNEEPMTLEDYIPLFAMIVLIIICSIYSVYIYKLEEELDMSVQPTDSDNEHPEVDGNSR
ncbi:hypothetical protein AHF37_01941 [Paragonimus kellicotti]|nr:hypothetical protein AHF37_01941 [Paragonimus kellicotti]